MFRRQEYFAFLKQKTPVYRTTVYGPGADCATEGLIETMSLGGCTSCAILSDNGINRLGSITHFRPDSVEDHLEKITRLTRIYAELKNAKNIALLWDGTNSESRRNPNGKVNRLVSGLKTIFTGCEIEEIPYNGALDWYGLYVDTGTLVFQ
jgi:hypothetical protein